MSILTVHVKLTKLTTGKFLNILRKQLMRRNTSLLVITGKGMYNRRPPPPKKKKAEGAGQNKHKGIQLEKICK